MGKDKVENRAELAEAQVQVRSVTETQESGEQREHCSFTAGRSYKKKY